MVKSLREEAAVSVNIWSPLGENCAMLEALLRVKEQEYVAATVSEVALSTKPFPVIAALVPLLVRVTERA